MRARARHLRLVVEYDALRPRTRGECVDGVRPCPWLACRHHLAIDVAFGRVHVNHPLDDLEDLAHTCALDVVEDCGPLTLAEVGEVIGVTRERVRQLEARALRRLRAGIEGLK